MNFSYVAVVERVLFLSFRGKHHVHLLAVQFGHHLYFGYFFKVGGKAQQQDFALFLEYDRAAAEEYILEICEISGYEAQEIQLKPMYRFFEEGEIEGKIKGALKYIKKR